MAALRPPLTRSEVLERQASLAATRDAFLGEVAAAQAELAQAEQAAMALPQKHALERAAVVPETEAAVAKLEDLGQALEQTPDPQQRLAQVAAFEEHAEEALHEGESAQLVEDVRAYLRETMNSA